VDQLRQHAESIVSGAVDGVTSAAKTAGNAVQSAAAGVADAAKNAASAAGNVASGVAREVEHVGSMVVKDIGPDPVGSVGRMSAEPLPAGELQGASIDTPESKYTSSRAAELRIQLGSAARFGTTMAVATGIDANGKSVNLIGTNEYGRTGAAKLRQNVTIAPDEILVPKSSQTGICDAETNIAAYAKKNGVTLTDIAATRPSGICSDCETALTSQSPDIHMSSPATGLLARSRR